MYFGSEPRLDDALVEVRGGRFVELHAAIGHDEARALAGRQVDARATQRVELNPLGLFTRAAEITSYRLTSR